MVKKKIQNSKNGKPVLFCRGKEKCLFCETTNKIKSYFKEQEKKIVSDHYHISEALLSQYSIINILKNLKIDEIWNIIWTYRKLFNADSKDSQNMNVEQLLEIDRQGLVTIGAHTLSHPILANEDTVKSSLEIGNSINELSNILGHEIRCFAYPNGISFIDFGQREINILKSMNCRISFSTESKNFTIKDHPLCIPRFGLSYGNKSLVKTKLLLGNNWNKIRNLKSRSEKKIRIELKNRIEKI